MPEMCSDCGQPAVGRFDLWSRPADDSELAKMNNSDRGNFDRPMCQSCLGRRGATPPAVSVRPLPAPVPSKAPPATANPPAPIAPSPQSAPSV